MAIRWTGKLSDELINVVNKYNKKINRLEKLDYSNLPSKINWKDIANSVKTRKDLYRTLEDLRTFNKRGSERIITLKSGVKTTNYQFNIAKRQQRIAKGRVKRRLNYLKSLEASEYGEKQGLYYYRMGDEQYLNLQKRLEKLSRPLEEISDFKNYTDYLSYTSLVDYNYRDKVYMNNYFDEMIFNLAYATGYDKNKINEMKNKIFDKLSDSQIYRMMNSEAAIKSLSEWYNIIHSRYLLNKTNINMVNNEFDALYESLDDIIKTYANS